MRHRRRTNKLSRTTSHRRCMFANMLKSLIEHERIETTVPKAKELARFAAFMITLAKENTLASRRKAIGEMMIRFNTLTPKEARLAKEGKTHAYNGDREVIRKLFDVLGPRYRDRDGGYTRIMRTDIRDGDCAERCLIEYLPE